MRKAIIIMLLALLPFCTQAQLQVKRTIETETIARLRVGTVELKHSPSGYYIVLPTTNRFDDPFILRLGPTRQEAFQTLGDLIALSSTMKKNATVVIENGSRECRISKGIGTLDFFADGYAGYASMTKGELMVFFQKMQELLNE